MSNFSAADLRQRYCQLLAHQASDHSVLNQLAFWEQAWREGMLAILWHRIDEKHGHVPDEVKQFIRDCLREQTSTFMRLRMFQQQLMQTFFEHEIDVICMRGHLLAEQLYHPSSMRPQTDVDLLIQPQDLERSKQALLDTGLTPTPLYPMLFERDAMLVDLHSEPLGIERIHSWSQLTSLRAEHFFDYAFEGKLLNKPALLTPDTLQIPYLAFHAMKHSFSRMIWLYDIALLCRNITDDTAWNRLQTTIETFALQRPCYYALCYVNTHFNIDMPTSLLAAIRPVMDWRERKVFARFLAHQQVPYLAERTFSRMLPSMKMRMKFWRETIVPSQDVQAQIAGTSGCVKCQFIRKRLKLLFKVLWLSMGESWAMLRPVRQNHG
ncbi:MAG: nucleotidyltransferase family protein [Mariprofundaceae bacterium]